MQKLREYQTFNCVQELNENELFVLDNYDLTDIQKDLYILLCRHSVKFPGVSFLKVDTIAETLHIATRTVRRHLKVLVDLQLIKRFKQVRIKSGGFGASLTIICPIDMSERLSYRQNGEIPCDTYNLTPFDEEETFSFKTTIYKTQENKRTEETLDSTYTSNKVPSEFVKLVKRFYKSAATIEEFYKVAYLGMRKLKYLTPSESLQIALDCFRQLIAHIKRGKRIKSLYGYYWGIIQRYLDKLYLDELNQLEFDIPDDHWLNA